MFRLLWAVLKVMFLCSENPSGHLQEIAPGMLALRVSQD